MRLALTILLTHRKILHMSHASSSPESFLILCDHITKACDGRPRDKGRAFESLVKDFLVTDSTQKSRFQKVFTYGEWSRMQGIRESDDGIDLVAQRHDGRFVAVQAKFYKRGSILKNSISIVFLQLLVMITPLQKALLLKRQTILRAHPQEQRCSLGGLGFSLSLSKPF